MLRGQHSTSSIVPTVFLANNELGGYKNIGRDLPFKLIPPQIMQLLEKMKLHTVSARMTVPEFEMETGIISSVGRRERPREVQGELRCWHSPAPFPPAPCLRPQRNGGICPWVSYTSLNGGFPSCLQGGTIAVAGFSWLCRCLKPRETSGLGRVLAMHHWLQHKSIFGLTICGTFLMKRHGWLRVLEMALYVFTHTQKAYWPDCLPAVHNSVFTSIIIYNKFQSREFVFIPPPTQST